MSDCFEMLMNNVCNMNEFIEQIKNIPQTIIENKNKCNVWTLNWAILLGFLNSLVSKRNQEASDGMVRRLMNLINIFGNKYPALNEIISDANTAQQALGSWNKQLLSNYLEIASINPNHLGYLQAVNRQSIIMNPGTIIPDFDVLLIVGGPAAECRIRLKIMLQYLITLEQTLSSGGDGKTRQIIISGRGGQYLREEATKNNWREKESKNIISDKTEAEYVLRLFLTGMEGSTPAFTEKNFPNLYSQCTISIDTAALDTVSNAIMAKYLILQNNFFNTRSEGEGEERHNTFQNKIIVSISNTYHITRLLYLMKNFIPRATHYGVILGNNDGDRGLLESEKHKKDAASANSILAAYQQTFTRDVGYIIPTLTRQCIDKPTSNLDLGLFEFLMHHGLYHRPSNASGKPGPNDTNQIWRTYMTSKDLINDIGKFCLPFTSLSTDVEKEQVINTRIFKENCTVARKIMERVKYNVEKFTFNKKSCGVPAPPTKYEGQFLPYGPPPSEGGRRKKKRSRRKRKKKRKKNKTRKK